MWYKLLGFNRGLSIFVTNNTFVSAYVKKQLEIGIDSYKCRPCTFNGDNIILKTEEDIFWGVFRFKSPEFLCATPPLQSD